MPTYGYQCLSCDNQFEVFQSIKDDALTVCEECGGALRKRVYPVGIAFKGSGFYVNDYAPKPAASSSASSETAKSDTPKADTVKVETAGETKSELVKTETKIETKTETKAETKPETKTPTPAA